MYPEVEMGLCTHACHHPVQHRSKTATQDSSGTAMFMVIITTYVCPCTTLVNSQRFHHPGAMHPMLVQPALVTQHP